MQSNETQAGRWRGPWAHDPTVCPSLECPGCWIDENRARHRAALLEEVRR